MFQDLKVCLAQIIFPSYILSPSYVSSPSFYNFNSLPKDLSINPCRSVRSKFIILPTDQHHDLVATSQGHDGCHNLAAASMRLQWMSQPSGRLHRVAVDVMTSSPPYVVAWLPPWGRNGCRNVTSCNIFLFF